MSNNTPPAGLDRQLSIEIARVTEAAAIASARWRGRGDKNSADGAAVKAMRDELSKVNIRGRVVIGEGEMDEAPMLYIGEELGTGHGPEVDIAVDPLEGTTICAEAEPNSLAVIAIGALSNEPSGGGLAREGFFDYYQRIRSAPSGGASPLHIVSIDRESIDRIGPWPWPRTILADIATSAAKPSDSSRTTAIRWPAPSPKDQPTTTSVTKVTAARAGNHRRR